MPLLMSRFPKVPEWFIVDAMSMMDGDGNKASDWIMENSHLMTDGAQEAKDSAHKKRGMPPKVRQRSRTMHLSLGTKEKADKPGTKSFRVMVKRASALAMPVGSTCPDTFVRVRFGGFDMGVTALCKGVAPNWENEENGASEEFTFSWCDNSKLMPDVTFEVCTSASALCEEIGALWPASAAAFGLAGPCSRARTLLRCAPALPQPTLSFTLSPPHDYPPALAAVPLEPPVRLGRGARASRARHLRFELSGPPQAGRQPWRCVL